MRRAIVFDLDGVLLDSGPVWIDVIAAMVQANGGRWNGVEEGLVSGGETSLDWAGLLARRHGLDASAEEVLEQIIEGLLARYAAELPVVPGASDAVRELAAYYRLGLASSSPAVVIGYVLERMGIAHLMGAAVSCDEVRRGKPDPAVYARACTLLGVGPQAALAVEDPGRGVEAAWAAGLRCVAVVRNPLRMVKVGVGEAVATVGSVAELTPAFVQGLWRRRACDFGGSAGTGGCASNSY